MDPSILAVTVFAELLIWVVYQASWGIRTPARSA
jgi:hypothetical protein